MTERVSEAVRLCINTIAVAQQNVVALHTISNRMSRNGKENEEVRRAIGVLHGQLNADVVAAWEQLSWFAPISKEAIGLLAVRTRTWFERDNTQIMHWLGMEGSYYVEDRKQFQREVMAMFGCDTEGEA